MATDRFSAVEDRVNRAVLGRLCNVVAMDVSAPAPYEFSAIFDNGYALGNVGMAGMAGTQPELKTVEALLDGEPTGKTLLVRGELFRVGAAEPDGTGWTVLRLERDE